MTPVRAALAFESTAHIMARNTQNQERCSHCGVTLATVLRMTGLRARVRAELKAEILAAAHRQLAEVGAQELSLRGIARELGMANSAIYRYFSSRDELLTALIIGAYDSLGIAGEEADRAVPPGSTEIERWTAIGRGAYAWARAHPAEFALIFGTPVPGYHAPPDTVGAATRFTAVLMGVLEDIARKHPLPSSPPPLSVPGRRDLEDLHARIGGAAAPEWLALGLHAWTGLIGTITFLMFGHLHNVVVDEDAFFEMNLTLFGAAVFRASRPEAEVLR